MGRSWTCRKLYAHLASVLRTRPRAQCYSCGVFCSVWAHVQDETLFLLGVLTKYSLLSSHSGRSQVESTQIGSRPVISVAKDVPAIEAYKILETNNRSGIAITDESGKICSATSARDLKVQ